jgi:hypothetical protein
MVPEYHRSGKNNAATFILPDIFTRSGYLIKKEAKNGHFRANNRPSIL